MQLARQSEAAGEEQDRADRCSLTLGLGMGVIELCAAGLPEQSSIFAGLTTVGREVLLGGMLLSKHAAKPVTDWSRGQIKHVKIYQIWRADRQQA